MAKTITPGGMAGMTSNQIANIIGQQQAHDARNQMGAGSGYSGTTSTAGGSGTITLRVGGSGLYDPNAGSNLAAQLWGVQGYSKTEAPPYDREEPDDALERAWLEKHGPALLPLAMAFYRHVVPHAVSCMVDADEDQRCRENAKRRALVNQALSNLRDMQALMNMGHGKVEELQSYLLDALDEMNRDPWFTKAKLFVSFHLLETYIVTMFDAASELSDQAVEALDALGEKGMSGSEFFKQSMKFVVASVRIAS